MFSLDTSPWDDPLYNDGAALRRQSFQYSKIVETFNHLFIPVFQQLRYIPLAAKIEIHLHLTSNDFLLFLPSSETAKLQVRFDKLNLLANIIELAPEGRLLVDQQLLSGLKLPFRGLSKPDM